MTKTSKSAAYQHKILEIPLDPFLLNEFQYIDGLSAQVQLSSFSERFYELRQNLIKEIRLMINSCLTSRQMEVMNLHLDGYSQCEIADYLCLHQTSVCKSLSGNIDYTKKEKKRYGGSIKKLSKLCKKNETIAEILEEMAELRALDMAELEETEDKKLK